MSTSLVLRVNVGGIHIRGRAPTRYGEMFTIDSLDKATTHQMTNLVRVAMSSDKMLDRDTGKTVPIVTIVTGEVDDWYRLDKNGEILGAVKAVKSSEDDEEEGEEDETSSPSDDSESDTEDESSGPITVRRRKKGKKGKRPADE